MNEGPITKLSRDFMVNFHQADYHGTAKVSSICNFLQETAWRHATALGLGFEDLLEKNLVWVIVSLKLKMIKYPKWTESIEVTTWPRGISGFFALRDFLINGEDGEKLGEATTAWMVIDMDRRRPQKVDFVAEKVKYPENEEKLTIEAPIIKQLSELQEKHVHTVPYNEIDFNGHVNNTHYVEWCLNAYPLEFHDKYQIDSILVNYLAEAHYQDEISIAGTDWKGESNLIQGTRKSDDKPVFRAEIEWKKIGND